VQVTIIYSGPEYNSKLYSGPDRFKSGSLWNSQTVSPQSSTGMARTVCNGPVHTKLKWSVPNEHTLMEILNWRNTSPTMLICILQVVCRVLLFLWQY
jgi:hypothetical protein